jgi:BirA family transcriptional regulator, biotin operon repressor / biotin---[acetyl-CoA-carboxylase] ligase
MPPSTKGDRVGDAEPALLGRPRLHLRRTDSTNERARELAIGGAPHGTLVTTAEQTAGRGRQGRSWTAPAGSALLCSLVLRDPPLLLSLIAGVAVCDAVGGLARVKWPNDVVMEAAGSSHLATTPTGLPGGESAQTETAGESSQTETARGAAFRKLAGILVEGRPQEGWAVLGIGLNVAVRVEELPQDVRERAASLELPSSAIEPLLGRLVEALGRRLAEPAESVLVAWRERDALLGRDVSWNQGQGAAQGIDEAGRLIVTLADGSITKLDAGEVHLGLALTREPPHI